MSYRLINSNSLALKYPEVNDMPCIYVDLPNGLDGGHYVLESSRRKGHWITEGIHWKPIFKCSECGSVIKKMPTVMDKPKYKGCPYCLAEMESDI